MKLLRVIESGRALAALLLFSILSGCVTTPDKPLSGAGQEARPMDGATSTEFHVGDRIVIDFADNIGIPPQWQQTVREDGAITLPLNQTIAAAGKRKGELETDIQNLYVPKILRRLTVNIRQEARSYFVTGEVKAPGQREHTGLITALKAIGAAGDFTDFADRGDIEIIRSNGSKIRVNGKKALRDPSLDVPVYPGDTVHVHRRFF